MALKNYPYTKPHVLINNPTAGVIDATINYKDGSFETVKLLPGVAIHFTRLQSIDMDSVDFANIHVGEYNNPENFFLG